MNSRGASWQQYDVVPVYREMLRERIHPGAWRVRVVVDCGNGTASLIAPQALEDLGCEVIRLYCESDPRFPHRHPDTVQSENLRDLIATVRREGALTQAWVSTATGTGSAWLTTRGRSSGATS